MFFRSIYAKIDRSNHAIPFLPGEPAHQASVSQVRHGYIGGDTKQPRLEMRVTAYFGQAFPGTQKGFLRQVASHLVVTHQPRQVGTNLPVVFLEQVAKSKSITRTRKFHYPL